MSDKPIYWIGSAKKDLVAFPEGAKRKAGFELRAVQQRQQPTDSKPMSIVGKGVEEIRIRAEGAYRVFYIASFEEGVYVLHAFQKKTQKTSRKDISLGQQRYQELMRFRGQQ